MKKSAFTIVLFIVFVLNTIAQENSVSVMVNVIPPYSHKVNDYIDNNKILVTLQYMGMSDNPEIEVYLQGEVSNDLGDRIFTNKNKKPAQPIILSYGVPFTITPGDLEDIFDFNYVETVGINKQNLYSGAGLPEATYTVCIRAYDYKTNRAVSAEEPGGCSASFEILNLEAPEIILPECGEILSDWATDITKGEHISDIGEKTSSQLSKADFNPNIQSEMVLGKMFAWIVPGAVSSPIEYELKIKKVPLEVEDDPFTIMNSKEIYIDYSEITSTSTVFVDRAKYEFEPGYTYIFTVTASDPEGNLVFQNKGTSEVCWFSYEDSGERDDLLAEETTSSSLEIYIPCCDYCDDSAEQTSFDNSNKIGLADDVSPVSIFNGNNAQYNSTYFENILPSKDPKTINVSNESDFYLRWEDLEEKHQTAISPSKDSDPSGSGQKGIVYKLHIYDENNIKVLEKLVWQKPFYQEEKNNLPFAHNKKYFLSIQAFIGTKTKKTGKGNFINDQFDISIDQHKGKDHQIGESALCEFTYNVMSEMDNLVPYTIKGQLKYKFQDYPEDYPLVSPNIHLVRYVQFRDPVSQELVSSAASSSFPPDNIMASLPEKYAVYMAEDGSFSTKVRAHPNGGYLGLQKHMTNVGTKFIEYQAYEYFILEIDNDYYKNPKTIVELSNDTVNLGKVVTNVYSYTLKIDVSKGYNKGNFKDLNPQNITAKLLRLSNWPADIPYYEGDLKEEDPKLTPTNIKHLSTGKVQTVIGSDGKSHTQVVFDKLICNLRNGDSYNINIAQDTVINGKNKRYISDLNFVPFKYVPTLNEVYTALANNTTNFTHSINATLLSNDPPTSTVTGKLVYRDPNDPESQITPLRNTSVGLIICYSIEDENGNSTLMDTYHIKKEDDANEGLFYLLGGSMSGYSVQEEINILFPDANEIVATDYTDDEGNFAFEDFALFDTLGVAQVSGLIGNYGGEHSTSLSFNGNLKRSLRLVVTGNKAYTYLNPSTDLFIPILDSLDVGVLTAFKNTYKLNLLPRSDIYEREVESPEHVIKGARIKTSQLLIPPEEQEQLVTSDEGCTITLIRHNKFSSWFDECFIHISTSDSVGENSFEPRTLQFPRGYQSLWDWDREKEFKKNNGIPFYDESTTIDEKRWEVFGKAYFNYSPNFVSGYYYTDDFEFIEVSLNAYMEPKKPIISGRILDASNTMRSVDNGVVNLYRLVSGNAMLWNLRTVSEQYNNGYFTFPDLYKDPNSYFIKVVAKGYHLKLAKQLSEKGDTLDANISFDGRIPAEGAKLKMGQQLHFPQILMQPNGLISGYVVNENGNPVKSFVRTRHSLIKVTEQMDEYGNNEAFFLRIPTYASDTLFIIPEDLTYFTEAIPIPALSDQNNELDLGKITVKERRHRIKIVVKNQQTNNVVPGVKVKILEYETVTDQQGIAEFSFKNASLKNFWYKLSPLLNDNYVETSGEFTNAESKEIITYTFYVKTGYAVKGRVTSSGEAVPYAEVWVSNSTILKKAIADKQGNFTLRGILATSSMSGGTTIKSAIIYCSGPSEAQKLSPSGIDFNNLIGQSKKVEFPLIATKSLPVVNFDLEYFKEANLSVLHGFPIKVVSLTDMSDGTYKITGMLSLPQFSSNFELLDTDKFIGFHNMTVKPNPSEKDDKGRSYFEASPSQPYFSLNKHSLRLKFIASANTSSVSPVVSQNLYNYFVKLEGPGSFSYLRIYKEGLQKGTLKSKARIVDNSFNFPGSYFRFDDEQFYFAEKVNNSLSPVISILSSGTAYANNSSEVVASYVNLNNAVSTAALGNFGTYSGKYNLTDSEGNDLKFHFLEFNASSGTSTSYITSSGSIVLRPEAWTLNPLLKEHNIIDTIYLKLPDIGLTAEGVNSTGVKLDKIEIKFEEWNIVANNCEVSPFVGGFKSTNAVIKTGTINIPIEEFTLRHDLLYLGKPIVENLTLGGICSLKIKGGITPQFGLDPKVGSDLKPHYKLCFVGDPAATVSELPGFSENLEFQAVSLISNGEQIISFAPNSKKLRFYDVADFRPIAIYSYDDGFSVDGIMDLGIPRISDALTYKLKFTRAGFKLKVNPVAQKINFDGPGYVRFISDPTLASDPDQQLFEPGKLTLYGTVSETTKLAPIHVKLIKTTNSGTNIGITRDPQWNSGAQQFIKFGEDDNDPNFIVDQSNMVVEGNDWKILKLKLIPDDNFAKNSGFGKEALHMAVFGEIKLDPDVQNQKIAVEGADTPFGDFNLTFDLPNKRMIGLMNIEEQKMGVVTFSGAAEMTIDPGGFYFVAAGEGVAAPFGSFSAGILVGHYSGGGTPFNVPQSAVDLVTRFSVGKGLPCDFVGSQVFSGLFVTGRKSYPPYSYKKEVNLAVVNAYLMTEVGVEASAWANFTKPSFGVSAMVYALAELSLGDILCTEISAKAEALLKAQVLFDLGDPTAELKACASINLEGSLSQKIPLPLGGCGATLFSINENLLSLKLEINNTINFASPSFSFGGSFGSGSCAEEKSCDK